MCLLHEFNTKLVVPILVILKISLADGISSKKSFTLDDFSNYYDEYQDFMKKYHMHLFCFKNFVCIY